MKKTFVFAGPSAVGKTYIADLLMDRYPDQFEQAKLYTTRQKREGDTATDRKFVTSDEFDTLVNLGKFLVHAEFGGNMYGFDHESLYPKDRHLLVNAWPWLISQFSELPHMVIVGMQAPENWQEMLVDRMRARGDNDETIQKRMVLIEKDRQDLLTNRALVDAHGKYFEITDNTTIPEQILPWIVSELAE